MQTLVVDAAGSPLVQSSALSFRPPMLENPVDVYLTSANRRPVLDVNTDYRIHLPVDEPVSPPDGDVQILGGRNIVLIGGEIAPGAMNRGLFIKGSTKQPQPRTVHIEGLKIGGQLSEGIDVDAQGERGLTVQFQNLQVGDQTAPCVGSYAANHADVLQCWNGPAKLLIDGLTGYTGYQGMMLQPRQFGGWQVSEMGPWDFRRVNLVGVDGFTTKAAYSVYSAEKLTWATCTDVYGTDGSYQGRLPIETGQSTDFVSTAGRNYISPGYLA